MEQITSELLKTIYKRAIEAAIAKFDKGEPDSIKLYDDGIIQAKWIANNRDWDDETEFLTAEDLTTDMDILAEQRKIKQEEERKQRLIYEAEQKKNREIKEKADRKATYLKLKKEFE